MKRRQIDGIMFQKKKNSRKIFGPISEDKSTTENKLSKELFGTLWKKLKAGD